MTTTEKRKHSRTESLRLLNYVFYDKQKVEETQGMGRTLNVSEAGILLETHIELNTEYTTSIAIGFEENVANVLGRVIYSNPNDRGMYESGIEFIEVDDASAKIIRQYTIAFNALMDNEQE